jgi:hypothetical protein
LAVSSPSLPAAATSSTPRLLAAWTAALSVALSPPPRLIEMTLTFWLAVQLMQFAMSVVRPTPAAVASALQMTSAELGATPATPWALFVFAAIVPATCEPWPLSSGHWPFWIRVPDV